MKSAVQTSVSSQNPGAGALPGGSHHPSRGRPRGTRTFTWMQRKSRYHHGSLRDSAVRRGLEIVAARGPMALTMRGLARELGVVASALVYYFHNRAGLRAAVAYAAAEQMRPFTVVRSGGERAGRVLRDTAASWVDYASKNPNLYRLVFGEGWRGDANYPAWSRRNAVHSIDRISNIGQMSGYIREGSPRDHGWLLFAAMHGLAFSRADGAAPAESVSPLIDLFVSILEGTGPVARRASRSRPAPR